MSRKINVYFIAGLAVLLIPYVLWFYLGEDSYILIHDNLDSEITYLKHIFDSNDILGFDFSAQINGVMNGIPRYAFRGGVNISILLFYLLPSYLAYIANHLIVHLFAFVGTWVLLKRYIVRDDDLLVLLISITFGHLAYYHVQYGLSIGGQPLLLFAFLNILHNNSRISDWLIIVIFAFYSFIIVTIPFFLPVLAIIGLIHYIKTRKIPICFILAMFTLAILSALVELPLIYSTLFCHDFTTHRSEWNWFIVYGFPTLSNNVENFLRAITCTHYHPGKLYGIFVIATWLVIRFFFKIKIDRLSQFLLFLSVGIALWIPVNDLIVNQFANDISLMKSFNSSRFTFIAPLIWLLLLASILRNTDKKKLSQRIVLIVCSTTVLIGVIINDKELIYNTKLLAGIPINTPTYRQFFDTAVFTQIKTKLGKEEIEQYNVVSIGIYPNIAQHFGFRTLDSYQNNYSLAYKHEFREIIEPELQKNTVLANYFDYWGSRCYIFTEELGTEYLVPKTSGKTIKNLAINIKQLKKMNAKYIFSSVSIENYTDLNLKYLGTYSTDKSYYVVNVYSL